MSGRLEKSSLHKTTSQQKRERLKRKVLLAARVAVALLALTALVSVVFALGRSTRQTAIFHLQEIEFRGARHTDTAELEDVIRSRFPSSILLIQLSDLRSLVESASWVEKAEVRRRLPDRIQIRIEEREPLTTALIDGELRVVDSQGFILDLLGPEFGDLDKPVVKGLLNLALEDAARENQARMGVYLKILDELDGGAPEGYSRGVSEIDVSDPERAAVIPEDFPVPVILGDRNFRSRFELFLANLEQYRKLQATHGAIESVDVTLDDRIIVHTPQAANQTKPESSL